MTETSFSDPLLATKHQWEFHDADTRHLTHSIHRYSGKFIPQIARQAIELLTEPGDLVLDPYAGSGTTLLEAMMSGRRAVGVDLNPLAVLISTTKVTPIEPGALEELWHMASAIPFAGSADELDIWGGASASEPAGLPTMDDPYFTKWFPEEVVASLNAIKLFADGLADQRLTNVTLVAMSDILRKLSRAHQGFPNVMFDKKREVKASVRNEFLGRLKDIIARDWRPVRHHRLSDGRPQAQVGPGASRGTACHRRIGGCRHQSPAVHRERALRRVRPAQPEVAGCRSQGPRRQPDRW